MIKLSHGLSAIFFAVLLHAVVLYSLLAKTTDVQGDAADAGEMGIEVGTGMLGSFANIQERISKFNQANIKTIEPKIAEQPKIKPLKKTPILPLKKETKKIELKANMKLNSSNNNSFKPIKKIEKVILEQIIPKEIIPKEITPDENPVPEVSVNSSATYVQAAIKSTGRSDQKKSGGNKGNAKNYINKMNRWLAQHQSYPLAAKKQKQEGTARVAFTINRQGKVLRRSIETSSGYTLLDEAALKVLDDASPLPEVPDDFAPGRAQLSLVKPIDFTLITNTSFKD